MCAGQKQSLPIVPAQYIRTFKAFSEHEKYLLFRNLCEFFMTKRPEHILKTLRFLSIRYSTVSRRSRLVFCSALLTFITRTFKNCTKTAKRFEKTPNRQFCVPDPARFSDTILRNKTLYHIWSYVAKQWSAWSSGITVRPKVTKFWLLDVALLIFVFSVNCVICCHNYTSEREMSKLSKNT